jgi:radical SAM-linked protein
MIQQKVEIRFEKGEAVRFISHHDLMRALMRAVRRAQLPVRLTEGFNPRPRIVFPVALEVGVASLDEAAEIEFSQCLSVQEVFSRLSSVFPPGLVLKAVKELPPRKMGQTPLAILYRLHLTEAGITILPERLTTILKATSLPFDRPRENRLQKVELRPALLDLKLEAQGDLLAEVRPSQSGSARPLELLSLLLDLPLKEVKHVRVTKLRMDLKAPPELTEEAKTERELLLKREHEAIAKKEAKSQPPSEPK